MAQLAKEMEELTAHNERIAMDKAQLTQELESLGVDTEGMSHAELRDKKDEIEREQSPERNASSEDANVASQPTVSEPLSAVQTSLEGMTSTAVENEKAVFSAPLPASSQIGGGYQNVPPPPHIADTLGPIPVPESSTNEDASTVPASEQQSSVPPAAASEEE
jgi:hypothetical protein